MEVLINEIDEIIRDVYLDKGFNSTRKNKLLEGVDIKKLLSCISTKNNSINFINRFFIILGHIACLDYKDWQEIIVALSRLSDKTALMNRVLFIYQYLDVDFSDFILESIEISKEVKILFRRNYLVNEENSISSNMIVHSSKDKDRMKKFDVCDSDLEIISKKIIKQGAKRAIKSNYEHPKIKVGKPPIVQLLDDLDQNQVEEFYVSVKGWDLSKDISPLQRLIEKADPKVIEYYFNKYPILKEKIYPNE